MFRFLNLFVFSVVMVSSSFFAMSPDDAHRALQEFYDADNPNLAGTISTLWSYKISDAAELNADQWEALAVLAGAGQLFHLYIENVPHTAAGQMRAVLAAAGRHAAEPSREYGPIASPTGSAISVGSEIESGLRTLTIGLQDAEDLDLELLRLLSRVSTLDLLMLHGAGEFLELLDDHALGELGAFDVLDTLVLIDYDLGPVGVTRLANLVARMPRIAELQLGRARPLHMSAELMPAAYEALAQALNNIPVNVLNENLAVVIVPERQAGRRRSSAYSTGSLGGIGSLSLSASPQHASGLQRARDSLTRLPPRSGFADGSGSKS